MGMQCTFNIRDLEKVGSGYTLTFDIASDTWTCIVKLPNEQGSLFFNYVEITVTPSGGTTGGFCWFDCGRLDATRIAMFRFLIENRICFTCA